MSLPRKPFDGRLHPRGFGGKFGHGTGTKKTAAPRNVARGVTTGGALKGNTPAAGPVAAHNAKFWDLKSEGGPKATAAKAKRAALTKGAQPKKAAPTLAGRGPKPMTHVAETKAAPKASKAAPKADAIGKIGRNENVPHVSPQAKRAAAKKAPAKKAPAKKRTKKVAPKNLAEPIPNGSKFIKETTGAENDSARGELPGWSIRHTVDAEGKEHRVADDVAGLSTDADVEGKRDKRLSPALQEESLARAKAIFEEGVAKAPSIRATIREVVGLNGGHMGREFDDHTGEPTSVKTLHSTFRKVQGKVADDGSKADDVRLGDAVRFTSVFSEDKYVEGVQSLRKSMNGLGYHQIDPPPNANGGIGGWALGPYRGLNMVFSDDNGFTFEVQAHTPKSLEVADHEGHKLYEVFRQNGQNFLDVMNDKGPEGAHAMTGINPEGLTPQHYRNLINDRMHKVATQIPIPKGLTVISSKDKWDQIVHQSAEGGYYDAASGDKLKRKPILSKLNGPVESDDLDVRTLADEIGKRYETVDKDSANYKIGQNWYPGALESIKEFVDGTNYTPAQGAAIVAAFSPNTGWAENMRLARAFIKGERLPKKGYEPRDNNGEDAEPGTLKANIARAERVRDMKNADGSAIEGLGKPAKPGRESTLMPPDPVEALVGKNPYGTMKIVSFHRNLLGDPNAVTVDRHAIRAALPGTGDEAFDTKEAARRLGNKGTYAKVAQAYRLAAKKHGITPVEMQALVWGQIRGTYS